MSVASRVCPSSSVRHATHLIGVVGPDARIRFVSPPLDLTTEFRDRSAEMGEPERRFRFAGPCIEEECAQWAGGRCGVIDEVVATFDIAEHSPERRCAVRPRCRWYSQRGRDACEVCDWIVTDTREHAGT